jgi:UDP-N-acetylglucosamine:LPS N-acetylglucosamine transferase
MKVVVTASGGGHTGNAVALAQYLYRDVDILFIIPKGDEWTRMKVEKYGSVVEIPKPRKPNEGIDRLVYGIPRALFDCVDKISSESKIFVSSGSNHSVAPAIIARFKGLKVYNLESTVRFVKPSLTGRWLNPISHVTVLQWEEQKSIHPMGKVYGPFYEMPEYDVRDDGYILVSGGTYGHKLLFDTVSEMGLDNIVMQTGRIDPTPYLDKHPDWVVFKFRPDFNKFVAHASIVISHLGKTVIDAALTYGKPVIIVPNPLWKLGATIEDSKILAKKINAVLVSKISEETLFDALDEIRSKRPPAYPNGAKLLADELIKIVS